MTLVEYHAWIETVPFGKRLPNALYLLRDANTTLGANLDRLVAQLVAAYQIGPEFNVLKFRTDDLKVSFLAYPDFLEAAHPALSKSVTVDLRNGKVRHTDYAGNLNPPILHRKETFLPTAHPRRAEFAEFSRMEEAAGLYQKPETIGFRLNWERLLAEKGYVIEGHTLHRSTEAPSGRSVPATAVEVHRHKTAITRYDLSKPVKRLLEHGLLHPDRTFFDYGCGQGTDVSGLRALGYAAEGWDPVHRPETPRQEADIVNLGFVLNVIEDPAERLETLVEAYRYARRVLVVSVLISEHLERQNATAFGDGLVSRRNTFQKFFEQSEFQQYVEDALETSAVPVALGVLYVFRDPSDQQDFLSARTRRALDWSRIAARLGLGAPPEGQWEALYKKHTDLIEEFGALALKLGRIPTVADFDRLDEVCAKLGSPRRALRAFVQGGGSTGLDWSEASARFGIGLPPKPQWELLYEQHHELLDAFWQDTLERGRMPAPEEFPRTAELVAAVGSSKRALSLLLRRGGQEALERAADDRRNDLLVYLAMANLRRKVPFGHLSPGLRLDVREFFGNYSRALDRGLELLYAAGDPGELEVACENLGLGWQDEQALYVHRDLLSRLPPVLRAYVGCATTLFGDVEQADLIKIHKASGKVTFLAYDDFDAKPLPELQRRTKVNLRTRWVEAFDHSKSGQCLYFKERFVSPDHPGLPAMLAFSAKLRKLGITEQVGFGPTVNEFRDLIERQGLNVDLNRKRTKLRHKDLPSGPPLHDCVARDHAVRLAAAVATLRPRPGH